MHQKLILSVIGLLLISRLVFASSFSEVIVLIGPQTLPETRHFSTTFFPIDQLDHLDTQSVHFRNAKIIVVELSTLINVDRILETSTKAFLRNSIEIGKQVWIIGVSIPDNFPVEYLGLISSKRIYHHSRQDYTVASGIWKAGQGYSTKNVRTHHILSREEIIAHITK